jgi:hypothetical protein
MKYDLVGTLEHLDDFSHHIGKFIIPTDELICFMVIASPTSYQLDIFGPVDPARKMMNTGGCRFFCKTGIPDIPFVAENHHCLS